MNFNVGATEFRLRIANEPIYGDGGKELVGSAHYVNREILISPVIAPDDRMDVLLHELKECWLFFFPRPRTKEEDCNFFAVCSEMAQRDLDRQGGLAALARMLPGGREAPAASRDEMVFAIGRRRWPVRISDTPVRCGGVVVEARADLAVHRYGDGAIVISCDQPRWDRRRLLFHELYHSWAHAFEEPVNKGNKENHEDLCKSVGEFCDLMVEQFEFQGGTAALMAMEPKGADALRLIADAPGDRRQCGGCFADVMCGSIESDKPTFSDEYRCFVMRRWMQCPACDSLTEWWERCSKAGTPFGIFLENPKPRVLDNGCVPAR